jgi:4,5-dihydroxyphthalate decarboxylase
MLETGELDALVSVKVPVELERGSARIRRLFPDHRRVERDYVQRTGFFPIMHLVVLRRDVYERHRWMAVELVKAFTRARELGWERLRRLHALAVSLPWLANELAELEELFDGDPFAYGVEPNRPLLDAMTRYSHEQGLAERKVEVDELFAPETLAAA